jgi:NDP-sugar pyrophosphorylase family protein
MQSLTGERPKPMLIVRGKPLLEHVLDRLRRAGFDRVLVVIGYRGEVIRAHFAGYPVALEFVEQTTLDGTARAALLARDFAEPDPFVLTFGDILCSPANYSGILSALIDQSGIEAAVGVKFVNDPHQGAAVYERDGWVTRIVEKPPPGASTTHWNSAGLFAFQSSIFARLEAVQASARGEYELPDAITGVIAAGKLVRLFTMEGEWRDVGRPEDLEAAQDLAD